MYGQKKKFSTFSYKLVQISPIMILVNSGAFLSISSWFCELTELIFVMILYISSTGYPPKTQRSMVIILVPIALFSSLSRLRDEKRALGTRMYGYVQVAKNSPQGPQGFD